MRTELFFKPAHERKLPLLLLCAFIAIRLLFYCLQPWLGIDSQSARSLYPDSATYIAPAKALLDSGRFLNNRGEAEIIRTPGYPLLIALFMKLFHENWVPCLTLFQLAFNAAACVLLIETLKKIGARPKIAYFLGAAALLNPHDAYFAFFILSDSFAQSFFMIFLYFFVKALKDNRTSDFAFAFASLTICIFIRPGSLFLPFFLMIGIVATLIRRGERKRVPAVLAAFLILIAVPIGAWQYRNRTVAGYDGFSAISEANLYFYHSAAINADRNGTSFYDEQQAAIDAPAYRALLETFPPHEAQRRLAIETIRSNIPRYLVLNLRGAALTLVYPGTFDIFRSLPAPESFIAAIRESYLNADWTPERIGGIFRDRFGCATLLNVLLLMWTALLTGAGMIRAIRAKTPERSLVIALIGIFFYHLAVSAGPNGFGTYPRFRLTISFLTLIWIGIGETAKRKTPEDRLTSEEATGAGPFPPSSAQCWPD